MPRNRHKFFPGILPLCGGVSVSYTHLVRAVLIDPLVGFRVGHFVGENVCSQKFGGEGCIGMHTVYQQSHGIMVAAKAFYFVLIVTCLLYTSRCV